MNTNSSFLTWGNSLLKKIIHREHTQNSLWGWNALAFQVTSIKTVTDCSEPVDQDPEREWWYVSKKGFLRFLSKLECGRLMDGGGGGNLISRESAQGEDFETH